jgi:CO/xanthine dehydrogenase Mo-binding subunit
MTSVPRRDFLKSGGAMIVGFSLGEALFGQSRIDTASARMPVPGPPDAKQIDTWLAIHADNTATIFIGFAELGQGNSTALLQVAAEELDLGMSQLKTVRLDTSITPNQGGTYSSASIQRGGPQVRTAAAEARFALLQLASKNLNAPVDRLTVAKGVVSIKDNPAQSITYGALVGDKPFHLAFTGTAPLKTPAEFKIIGTGIPRNDIPDKVSGRYVYMQHVRVPEMLHGRVVRPRGQSAYGAGAKVLHVDESSIRNIPGVRLIHRGDFVGVVAENEWNAVRAAQQLKITWDVTPALPGVDHVYEAMRAAKTTDRTVLERGDVGIFGSAPHVVSLTCHGPYQAHAPFGPNCALADVKPDSATVMCSTQDVYGTRGKLAPVTGLPADKIRVQYYEGSGTYGHSCYDDVAQAAAILSQAAGKPVRLQFMRWDEHGWDNYGPAHVGDVRAAADATGKIVAYEYHGWQHNWSLVETSEHLATGKPPAEWPGAAAQQINAGNLGAMYSIPNLRLINHQVSGMSYLKGGWLRSPLDLSFSFASEQAIDHLAWLVNRDSYEFRKRNITDIRWMGVLDAAAKAANWQPRRSNSNQSSSPIVNGRGIGLGTHLASYGGAVAEIEVNQETGRVVAKHLYGAIDAGLAVNPAFVENQISGQLVQAASRMFREEVKFNTTNVTSLDWNSYPILRFDECPEVTPVVVQRLDQKSSGAGEEVMAATAGAIANAFFDATGVRMHEYPLTPARVLAALKRG